MARLDNTRHEIFSHNLAKGMLPELAYAAAGYKPQRQNAHRLKTKDDIRRRVAELQDAAAEANRPNLAKVMQELSHVALSNIGKAVEWKGAVRRNGHAPRRERRDRHRDYSEVRQRSPNCRQRQARSSDCYGDSGDFARPRWLDPCQDVSHKVPALLQLLDHLRAMEELEKDQPALKPQPGAEKVIDFKALNKRYGIISE